MRRIPRTLSSALLGLAAFGVVGSQAAPLPLPLVNDRFSVEATWTTGGLSGTGTGVSLTPETGYFWFFSPSNSEVVVKVLDACGVNGRFWVFAGGLTDTGVTLTVTDEATGARKTYSNPVGTPFAPIQDTGAFASCAAEHCGQGRFADLAASPRAEIELEGLAAEMSGALAAPQAVYDRVVADVRAIRAANRNVEDVTYRPDYSLQRLYLELDGAATTAIASGTYTAWDCLNRRYGMTQVSQQAPGHIALLRFTKVLDIEGLIRDYEALPGVLRAYPEATLYLTPIPIPIPIHPSSICGRIEGDVYRYFFRIAGGGLVHFTSQTGTAPTLVGSYDGTAVPWLAEAQACFAAQNAILGEI